MLSQPTLTELLDALPRARVAVVAEDAEIHAVPGLHIVNATDTVGAGDSMLAGIAAALATGARPLANTAGLLAGFSWSFCNLIGAG